MVGDSKTAVVQGERRVKIEYSDPEYYTAAIANFSSILTMSGTKTFYLLRRFANGARPKMARPNSSIVPPRMPPSRPPRIQPKPVSPPKDPEFYEKVNYVAILFGVFCISFAAGCGTRMAIDHYAASHSDTRVNEQMQNSADADADADVDWKTDDPALCDRCCQPGRNFCPKHDVPREH